METTDTTPPVVLREKTPLRDEFDEEFEREELPTKRACTTVTTTTTTTTTVTTAG